jgi:predicted N-acetyltransferase YhbS
MMKADFTIRPARVEEIPLVLDLVNAAFPSRDKPNNFLEELPYLWNADRANNNIVCLKSGKIVGNVSVYPLKVRMNGVDFNAAGVGQVCTLPECRGDGVMSALLQAAVSDMDGGRYDFTWLWGDRIRYGRHGWTHGGTLNVFEVFEKHLSPPPPASEVRPYDVNRDFDTVSEYVQRMPFTVHFSRAEMRQLLAARKVWGAFYRSSWIAGYYKKELPIIMLSDGNEDELTALFAHAVSGVQAQPGEQRRIVVHGGPFTSAIDRALCRCYGHMRMECSAAFRICGLKGFFEKAVKAVEPSLRAGSDELSIRNTDNGQEVRISCDNGQFRIADKAGSGARSMSTLAISEAVFGVFPLDVTLPGLAQNSPIRSLLRLPCYISRFFAL